MAIKKSNLEMRSGIDMAPMVDIVFLLITYFLINSSLAQNPAIKIELPQSVTASEQEQKNTVIFIDKDNRVFLNDQPVELEKLGEVLQAAGLAAKNEHVVLKGDKNASYQTIVSVMDKVHQAGISSFNLATDR